MGLVLVIKVTCEVTVIKVRVIWAVIYKVSWSWSKASISIMIQVFIYYGYNGKA
jgi:hypothetical protein